jgi:hypothetical protein
MSPTTGDSSLDAMETVSEAIARLERRGYHDSFRATAEGLLALGDDRVLEPEALVVDEIVRFEGESNPGDEAVVFALRSRDDRVRGTFVTTYGANTEPANAEMMHRLDASHRPARQRRAGR